MKIAIFGAGGMIGQRVVREVLSRGHQVTAVARDPSRLSAPEGVAAVRGDATDAASVAGAVRGHDAVISSVGPSATTGTDVYVGSARALIAGLRQAGVKRLLVVGGAGSLEVAPGVQLVDTPGFPAAWKPAALATRDALGVFRSEADGLDWTYLSPAALIEPGERTGRYRTGGDQLLTDAEGHSRISAEDFAIALVDELEQGKNVGRRMTAAY
ncbi:MAG TPA: NAD(P)-dependent oxidoreductase [Longimicrobium sp.]